MPILHRLRAALGLLVLLPLVQGSAHAAAPADSLVQTESAQTTASAPEAGVTTRQWVNAQGQREQASATRQTLSGPVMRRVHERYLKSFEAEIPTRLRDSESFGKR